MRALPCIWQAPRATQTQQVPAASPHKQLIQRRAPNFNFRLRTSNLRAGHAPANSPGVARGPSSAWHVYDHIGCLAAHYVPNKCHRADRPCHGINISKGEHPVLIFGRAIVLFVPKKCPKSCPRCPWSSKMAPKGQFCARENLLEVP